MGFKQSQLIWFPEKVQKALKQAIYEKLQIVGEMMRAAIVRNISIPTRSAGPSKPGEYPHADTGRLKQDIFYKVDKDSMTVAVGTKLDYGYWLETGTRYMAARPFLRTTLSQMKGQIQSVFNS
jgi:HK97 gp10 family phage protein